jgi:hypothetical protein
MLEIASRNTQSYSTGDLGAPGQPFGPGMGPPIPDSWEDTISRAGGCGDQALPPPRLRQRVAAWRALYQNRGCTRFLPLSATECAVCQQLRDLVPPVAVRVDPPCGSPTVGCVPIPWCEEDESCTVHQQCSAVMAFGAWTLSA